MHPFSARSGRTSLSCFANAASCRCCKRIHTTTDQAAISLSVVFKYEYVLRRTFKQQIPDTMAEILASFLKLGQWTVVWS